MSSHQRKVPLGAILQQAGLVSADSVEKALRQQQENNEDRRIGEILASQGYIHPQTADFFAESWSTIIGETHKKPIGYYFKQAKLLDARQVKSILERQQKTNLKFGEQAVTDGLLNQATVDFFLRYLSNESKIELEKTIRSPESTIQSTQVQDSFYKIKLRLLNLEDREDYYKIVLERILFWTEGQSVLTQKSFKLIKEYQNKIIAGKEAEQVDRLVKTKIIKNWRDGIAGKHLQTIEERVVQNQQIQPATLIELYQKTLTKRVVLDDSLEQQELIKIGLVAKQKDHLVTANRIYKSVFDYAWAEEKASDIAKRHGYEMAIISEKPAGKISTIAKKGKKRFPLKNLLLLFTLIILLLVFFDNLIKRIKVKKAFETGNQLLQQKSYEKAISQYNKLLNIDSNYFQAWTNRGYALAGLQKYEEMRESCSTATIINPEAVYAWNCQGEALHNLNREEAAINAFNKAIALEQTDPIFLINKSESLKSLGQEELSLTTIKQAIQALEQIEAIEGKNKISSEFAVALTFLGNGYRKQEKYEPAIFSYNRALEYSPNYFPAQIGKGIILNRVRRYLEAQEVFQDILKNEGLSTIRQAQTWFYLGKSLCQSGQNTKSIAAFDKAIELDPDYEAAKQAKQNCE